MEGQHSTRAENLSLILMLFSAIHVSLIGEWVSYGVEHDVVKYEIRANLPLFIGAIYPSCYMIPFFAMLPRASRRWAWSSGNDVDVLPLEEFRTQNMIARYLSATVFSEWETRGTGCGLLMFAIKPVLEFLAVLLHFVHVDFICRTETSPTWLALLAITASLDGQGFVIAQALKHLRSHYRLFVCLMTFAVCASHDAFGAAHTYTWAIGGLSLALIFFNHRVCVYDDELHLIRIYPSYPRHRVGSYPRFSSVDKNKLD